MAQYKADSTDWVRDMALYSKDLEKFNKSREKYLEKFKIYSDSLGAYNQGLENLRDGFDLITQEDPEQLYKDKAVITHNLPNPGKIKYYQTMLNNNKDEAWELMKEAYEAGNDYVGKHKNDRTYIDKGKEVIYFYNHNFDYTEDWKSDSSKDWDRIMRKRYAINGVEPTGMINQFGYGDNVHSVFFDKPKNKPV